MFTGSGELVLRGGRHLPLRYEMIDTGGVGRCGHLALDASELDPAVFFESMELHCDDGVRLVIAVTNYGDRNVAFIGRVLAPAA
ncbi:hypothetical protein [Bosea thiooxidans]